MKTNDLRTTVLILGCTLLIAFVSSSWWVSRQARALREIHEELVVTKKELGRAFSKLHAIRSETDRLRDVKHSTERQMALQPAKYPVWVIRHAKLGFNDIQRHVAKGEFRGLALTDGYMELKMIFENPALEEMLDSNHGPLVP